MTSYVIHVICNFNRKIKFLLQSKVIWVVFFQGCLIRTDSQDNPRIDSRILLNTLLPTFRYNFLNVFFLCVNMIKFIEKHEKTRAIFVDFAKAIDTMNHDILLRKLEHYGIREKPLERWKSYLENRKQCVKKQSVAIAVIWYNMWSHIRQCSRSTSFPNLY